MTIGLHCWARKVKKCLITYTLTDEPLKRDSQFKLGSRAAAEKFIQFNKKMRVKYLNNRLLSNTPKKEKILNLFIFPNNVCKNIK